MTSNDAASNHALFIWSPSDLLPGDHQKPGVLTEQHIDLFVETRRALIAAAVTGELETPGVG